MRAIFPIPSPRPRTPSPQSTGQSPEHARSTHPGSRGETAEGRECLVSRCLTGPCEGPDSGTRFPTVAPATPQETEIENRGWTCNPLQYKRLQATGRVWRSPDESEKQRENRPISGPRTPKQASPRPVAQRPPMGACSRKSFCTQRIYATTRRLASAGHLARREVPLRSSGGPNAPVIRNSLISAAACRRNPHAQLMQL